MGNGEKWQSRRLAATRRFDEAEREGMSARLCGGLAHGQRRSHTETLTMTLSDAEVAKSDKNKPGCPGTSGGYLR